MEGDYGPQNQSQTVRNSFPTSSSPPLRIFAHPCFAPSVMVPQGNFHAEGLTGTHPGLYRAVMACGTSALDSPKLHSPAGRTYTHKRGRSEEDLGYYDGLKSPRAIFSAPGSLEPTDVAPSASNGTDSEVDVVGDGPCWTAVLAIPASSPHSESYGRDVRTVRKQQVNGPCGEYF